MPNPTHTLFDPLTVPCQGMNSALVPSALNPGEWALLENVRLGDRSIKVRGGTPSALGTINASGSFRGCWQGIFNGTYTLFVANAQASVVKVYKSTDAATWTEITAGSGAFGNTRLTDTGNFCTFEKVYQPVTGNGTAGDSLIIQNNSDDPRVYSDSLKLGGYIVSKIQAISAPTIVRDAPVKLRIDQYLSLFAAASVTYSNDGSAHLAMSDLSGAGTNQNQITLTVKTTAASTNYALGTFGSSPAMFLGKQVIIGFDGFYTSTLLANVKIEVAGQTIWDPSSNSYEPYYIVPLSADSSKNLVAFNISSLGISSATTGNTLKITWVGGSGSAPSTDQTVNIFCVIGGTNGPQNPGLTQFGITYYNQSAKTESPGVILTNYQPTKIDNNVGAPGLNIPIPNDTRLYFTYQLPISCPGFPDTSGGADELLVYRMKDGETQFTFSDELTLATWGGASWSHSYSTPPQAYVSTSGSDSTYSIVMPDGFHLPVPIGKAMRYANGRLFVGCSASGESNLLFSEYKYGFRFRRYTRYLNGVPDETSPSSQDIRGETVNAIAAVASSVIGVSTVYIFTDQQLYACQGVTATQLSYQTRIGPHGTLSGQSVAELKNTLFWLDKEGQVRRLQHGIVQDLGRRIIDDQTKGIPGSRKANAYGCCFNDRYYLAYTPSGGSTNTKILVWEDYLNLWVRDVPPVAAEGLLAWFDGTNKRLRLLLFGSDGKDYEYDVDGTTGNTLVNQDLGQNIQITLKTHDIHEDGWSKNFIVNRIGILTNVQTSGVINYTRTYKPTNNTGISTVNIDQSTALAYLWDAHIVEPSASPTGAACQVTIAGALKGGASILGLVCEIQGRSSNYAVSTT